ncbi:single-stranded DNA-binding protein [Rothia nasimurium]|uniref:single-stranded DNA-binding protein n=1 Tax=Rothia nasimurium TaxID=85336 RepID=UPI003BA36B6B
MSDTVTIRGFIATAPTQKYLPGGNIPVTNFRVASTPRWFDAASGTWREGNTNWYNVNAFRSLAHNGARSLHVGQPVLVTGRLKIKQFDRADGTTGTSIDIDASAIGHDLNYGIAGFTRISDRKPEVDDTDRKFNEQVHGDFPGTQANSESGSAEETINVETGEIVSSQQPGHGLIEQEDEAVVAMTS